ncbi:MAG: DNA recombination protein RmuC [Dehalobacter sp.]|nr:DNA recombination protein RmuC [Dehalobacter sp.]
MDLVSGIFIIIAFIVGFFIATSLFWAFIKKKDQEIKALAGELKTESEQKAAAIEKSNNVTRLENEVKEKIDYISTLERENSSLKTKIETEDEKLTQVNNAKQLLIEAFKALSADALRSNNQEFLVLAKSTLDAYQVSAKGDLELKQKAIDDLVKPIKDSLGKIDEKISQDVENRRVLNASLSEQIRSLASSESQLLTETANLAKALRKPTVRGQWGEVQLKRTVELSGMVKHCDFNEQVPIRNVDCDLRPDLIVYLPNNKSIIVDSKTPLSAYLEAIEAKDEDEKVMKLDEHASQVKTHVNQLSSKSYWNQLECTPEFVVMFLPGESIFSAALERDPTLIEYGVNNHVIIATPTTLIALLKAVAYGWKQEDIAKNSKEISELGKDLYSKLRIFSDHLIKVGKNLDKAVESYNDAIGSLEMRLLSTARKFKDLEVSVEKEIEETKQIDHRTRVIQSEELIADGGDSNLKKDLSKKD